MIDMEEICNEVDQRFGEMDAGKTLVYLYRRFGVPNIGSDDYKDVCAYLLNTEMEESYVIIHIRGISARVRWTFTKKVQDRYLKSLKEKDSEFVEQCHESIRHCLKDLMRPVYVRDVEITIFGKPTDAHKNLEVAEASTFAGYALPTEFQEDPKLFCQLLEFVDKAGNGDVRLGIKFTIGGVAS